MTQFAIKTFDKHNGSLLAMFRDLIKGNKEFESMLDIPMIEGDKLIVFAITMQNALHPTTNMRTEAINSKNYVEIKSHADAEAFL